MSGLGAENVEKTKKTSLEVLWDYFLAWELEMLKNTPLVAPWCLFSGPITENPEKHASGSSLELKMPSNSKCW